LVAFAFGLSLLYAAKRLGQKKALPKAKTVEKAMAKDRVDSERPMQEAV